MEAAIRWSPRATPEDARFLIVDVDSHTLKLCEALGVRYGKIQWNEISRNSKVPPFRAYDWAAAHDIVAVGHYAGATVVGLANGSPSLSLPLKLPRNCNAVAFNSDRLLASGVERVRNDYCLNVYDVSHWPAAAINPAESRAVEPAHKLAMSEAITSIKFFPSNPSLLVAGVKGTCIRLYDLRERTGNPASQYQTTRVHNIAVDLSDDWYFASAGPAKDSTIHLWDRRFTVRNKSSSTYLAQDGPLVELQNVLKDKKSPEPVSVWSLRFSPEKRGCLGIMCSNGTVKVCHLRKDYAIEDEAPESEKKDANVNSLTLDRTQALKHPHLRQAERTGETRPNRDQIVSFDFMNFFSSTQKYRAITLGLHQDVHVHEIYRAAPTLAVGRKGFMATSDWRTKNAGDLLLEGLRLTDSNVIDDILAKQYARRRGSLNYARAAVRKEGADTWVDWEDQMEKTDTKPIVKPDYVTQATLNRVFEVDMQKRAKAGYLLNASKNEIIVADDPALSLFWRWVQAAKENANDGNMIGEGIDFSFLGAKNIINASLGADPHTRCTLDRAEPKSIAYAISWLMAELNLTGIDVKEGFYTPRRRLALHAIGFRNDTLKSRVQKLSMAGKNPEAALRALILCDNSLVMGALMNGPRRNDMTFFFDDMHKWLTTDQAIDHERRKMISVKLAQEEDPFVHAIYHIVLSDRHKSLTPIVNPALPFHYRLAISLRYIDDDVLKENIEDETRAAIRGGEIDKIMLTGLSDEGLQLIANYLHITADLQTAVLAAAHVVPRYIRRSTAVERWRAAYRTRLNAWGMHLLRCQFDVEASKLAIDTEGNQMLHLNPPQVALRCGNCDGPMLREQSPFSGMNGSSLFTSASGTRSFGGGVLGGVNEVTQCPRCGARLPHCAVCDMPTGVLDPLSRGAAEKEREDMERERNPLDDLMELCMTCEHVYHRGCAEAWFAKHQVCPAVGCGCVCDDLDEEADYDG